MRELLLKSVICLIAVTFLVNIFTAIAYADNPNFAISSYKGESNGSTLITPTKEIASVILGAVRIVGAGVALIMIAVVAMKYMMAAPGDRADYKKSSVQFVIGALFVLGSTQIVSLLIEVASNALND